MPTEQLHAGAPVRSREGHKLGVLSHFIINRATNRLTHIVVDTGILRSGTPLWEGGWGLSHDRVVPVGVLRASDNDGVELTMSADEFRDLSVDYIQERFQPYPDDVKGRVDLSDVGRFAMSIPGEPGPWVLTEETARRIGEADVREDMPVWRMNPHEKIGEVERVLIDEGTRAVTALVIRRGFLFTKEVVLPMNAVIEVLDHVVRVDLDDAALRALAEYEA
jgi:sporulation protein YlmC with PRC-barrel domain